MNMVSTLHEYKGCQEISQKTIERALKKLTEEEKIAKVGAGKSTAYVDMKRME